MKWNWNELFGSNCYIEIKNSERKYFGLDEINPAWEKSEIFSKTNSSYRRIIVFWEKNMIKKVIAEEVRMTGEKVIHSRYYQEFDTEMKTENREFLLPLTEKGRKKKLTASNILAVTPFGCRFYFSLECMQEKPKARIEVSNLRNDQRLAIGETEKICKISGPEEFRMFIEEYVKTCPAHYFDRIKRMRNEKHQTVKYRPGDIFRIETDRLHYCYGLITGEVKKIREWPELPEKHSMRSFMMVPVMVRFYELITENGELKADDLKDVPLSRVRICGDNDIIWGTHPIIDHKELETDDVEFYLFCSKYLNKDRRFDFYIEWGTAAVIRSDTELPDNLKEYLTKYDSPDAGVSIRIWPDLLLVSEEERKKYKAYRDNLLEEHNQRVRGELFSCLGLSEHADFDEFAEKFGGLKKAQILQRIISRE